MLLLYSFLPFGPLRIKLLKKHYSTYGKIWRLDKKELMDIGVKSDLASKFDQYRNKFNTKGYFENLKRLGINYVTIDDLQYPQNLRGLDNAPLVLYVKGKLSRNDTNAISVIGSRKMTSYGREVAYKISYELSQVGVTIISGLALGIDAVAHKGAIEAGGRTVAVLASGLDMISPATNRWIADKIIKGSYGAIVSEYPLGTSPVRANFANRNRIISGLSKAVVVVEGRRKSGTLLTAGHAAEQGREVYAIPGQITSPLSEAPHFLIKNGAKFAFSSKDILDELDMQLKVNRDEVEKLMPSDKLEEQIAKVLENEEKHIDEVARALEMKAGEVASKLSMMELKGLIVNLGDGSYRLL